MSTNHVVKSGETLSQIARRHGFQRWRLLWDAPENADLRSLRGAPEALRPGDAVVIPARNPRQHPVAPDDCVELTLDAPEPLALFELGLFDSGPLGGALAGFDVDLRLPGDGKIHRYRVPADGIVRLEGELVAAGEVQLVDAVDATADPTIPYQHCVGQLLPCGQCHDVRLPNKRRVADAVANTVAIGRRAAWGAAPPKVPLDPDWDYTTVVLHHSGNSGERSPKAIQDKQLAAKYDDIAYEYVVGLDGKVWEGRHLAFKSAANSGQNTGKIAIIVAGDFEHQWWDRDDDVTPVALDSVVRLVNCLRTHFSLTRLIGHRDIPPGNTECPGSELYKELPGLRARTELAP